MPKSKKNKPRASAGQKARKQAREQSAEQAQRLAAAVEHYRNGRLQEAHDQFRALLRDDPKSHAAHYWLGVLQIHAGNDAEAIKWIEQAVKLAPREANYRHSLGKLYMKTGAQEPARAMLGAALTLEPENAALHSTLGVLLIGMKEDKAAEDHMKRAVEYDPRNFEAFNNLGLFYLQRGVLDRADEMLRKAIAIKPDYVSALHNFAQCQKLSNRLGLAQEYYEKILAIDPRHIGALVNLGIVTAQLNQPEASLDYCRRALAVNPREVPAYMQILRLMDGTGEDQAVNIHDLIEMGKKHLPGHPLIAFMEARWLRRKGEITPALEKLRPLDGEGGTVGMKIQFELGQLCDKTGDYAEAFAHFTKANKALASSREAQVLDWSYVPGRMKNIHDALSPEWLASWTPPVKNTNFPDPVFLVGFPRSGTTLLDQILFSHPDIHVASERQALAYSFGRNKYRNYPHFLVDMTPETIEDVRRNYYETHKSFDDWRDRPIFIDKNPMNMHFLDLVYRAFPAAKVVLAVRHPCDCVLSSFMQEFIPNMSMVQTYDLERCARFYTESMALFEKYEQVVPLAVYKIRYENVLGDFRGEIGGLLDFIGAKWDDSVLEYDRTARERRFISTPSYSQVTEKIYEHARYRWTHYRGEMTPVLDMLRPWAEKLGYAME